MFANIFKSFAQTIGANTTQTSGTLGKIKNLQETFVFSFNLLRWVGLASVFVGIVYAISALIWKLFNSDTDEDVKAFQSHFTKAVLIALAGLLVMSVAFIINLVADLLDITSAPGTIESIETPSGGSAIPAPPGGPTLSP